MTTSMSTESPAPGRTWAWIAAAAVLVVATVAAVLVFGVERPPAFEPVAPDADAADTDAPDVRVAWTRFDPDGSCLWVIEPDGSGGEVACGLPDGRLVGWDDRGLLLESFREEPELVVLDPGTGEVRDRETVDPPLRPDLREVATRRPTGPDADADVPRLRIEARDDGDVVVAEVEAAAGYDVRFGAYAPDGGWVALLDNAGRLLVVPVDERGAGIGPPRLWRDDVDASQLIWEGTRPRPEGG